MFVVQISFFCIPPINIALSIIVMVNEGMQVAQMLFLLL